VDENRRPRHPHVVGRRELELHVLHDHGWSIAALAREFGLDWRTARHYAGAGKPPRYRPRTCPVGLTAAQLAHVERAWPPMRERGREPVGSAGGASNS
jgi:hypothetical protein